jgi:hypothetical protein
MPATGAETAGLKYRKFQANRTLLHFEDLLVLAYGAVVTDASNAAATGLRNAISGAWMTLLCEKLI